MGFAGLIFVTRKPGAVLIVPGFAKTNTIALDRQAQFPFINVIVSSSITQSGSMIAGDIPKLAIVQINPGYASSPGQDDNGNGSRGNVSATVGIQRQDAVSFC